jgi:hypothetical protein
MRFLHDITHRNGQGSSKKFWYNIAGLTATIVVLWVCYKDTMEDYAFICLFLTYLLTVGGFEVILKMTQMIVDIKSGHSSTTVTTSTTKENTNAIPIAVS